MSRTIVVVCHRAAPTECSRPSSKATKIDPGSGSGSQSAGAASKQTEELSASATCPAQVVFSPSTCRDAHWLSGTVCDNARESWCDERRHPSRMKQRDKQPSLLAAVGWGVA